MKDLDFTGKIAIVTGAASGIGRATADALARRGATVARLDLKGPGTLPDLAVDVSDHSAVILAVEKIAEAYGGVDLLAHCAGIQSYGNAASTTPAEWSYTLAVDLDSAYAIARAVLPQMRRRGGGSIVFTGSTQSLTAHRNSAAYVTGKHAIVGLTRSIALDFAGDVIRCNCVLPGAIDTPMLRNAAALDADPQRVLDACSALSLFHRMGTPEEAANAYLFLLSPMASFITGISLVVDGGQLVPCGGTLFQDIGMGAISE